MITTKNKYAKFCLYIFEAKFYVFELLPFNDRVIQISIVTRERSFENGLP